MGFDRTAQRWWSGNQTHLTHPRKAHVKGSRYGRRRERQNIHVLAQCLDFFLLIHTKTLFLIHHQQTKFVEGGVLAEQLVCAHHRIDGASLQLLKNCFALTGRAETIEQSHLDRVGGKTF